MLRISGLTGGLPDTISARYGDIKNRIGKAEALPIFDDIISANLKLYRYDIVKTSLVRSYKKSRLSFCLEKNLDFVFIFNNDLYMFAKLNNIEVENCCR